MKATRILTILTLLAPGLLSAQWPKERQIDKVAVASLTLDGYPDFLAPDAQGVWVTNEGRVEKLFFGDSSPAAAVPMPQPCGAMAVGFGSLWVASCEHQSVYRIDLQTRTVAAIIATGLADPSGELSIAIGAGSVWLLTSSSGELSRIDPIKNEVVRRIQVEPQSFAAVFGFGSVWVTNTHHSSVQRIDPTAESVVATIPVGKVPRFLAAGAGGIWTLNQDDGTVSRIDPKSHTVINIEVNASGTGGDIAASEKYVYVRAKTALLLVIDAHANKVIARYGPPAGSGAVRFENGRVWITAHDIHKVWVIKE